MYMEMCNVYLWDDVKVLHGGMRQVPIEMEEKEIDIPKEILEEERHLLYGKELDSFVLENYYKTQLPERTYQKCLRLDNTLPYVSTCIYMFCINYCIIYFVGFILLHIIT